MVDHAGVLSDLQDRLLTQDKIAEKHGCSVTTVVRIAKQYNAQYGQGRKHFWKFQLSSPELARVCGAYLTDGWISFEHGTPKPRQVTFAGIYKEYMQEIFRCLDHCGLSPRWQATRNRETENRQPLYLVATYVSLFAEWLNSEAPNKSKIPEFLWNSPLDDKVAFVSSVIDGDGSVGKDGTITVRKTFDWILELPDFCRSFGLGATNIYVTEILESGKSYFRTSIKRSDFRNLGGFCFVPHKQERILNGKDTRNRKR